MMKGLATIMLKRVHISQYSEYALSSDLSLSISIYALYYHYNTLIAMYGCFPMQLLIVNYTIMGLLI